jgi:anaerobic selenocysteine-containing dehydrogenase
MKEWKGISRRDFLKGAAAGAVGVAAVGVLGGCSPSESNSDLLYHLMVLLVEQGVSLDEIFSELKSRR